MTGSGSNVIPAAGSSSATFPLPQSSGVAPPSGPLPTVSAVVAPPAPATQWNPWLLGGGLAAVIAVAVAITFASTAYIARMDNTAPAESDRDGNSSH